MKKIVLLGFALIVFYMSSPSVALAACGDGIASGTGASDDPYQITTPTELAAISNCLGVGNSGKYFDLANDIDLDVSPYNTGSGWTPIGVSGNYFYGKFDGNNHTISNLFINTTTSVRGLFGYTQSSLIENLVLSNVNITSTQTYVGGLVGYSNTSSVITNVSVSGTISSSSSNVGGLAGYTNLTIISDSDSSVTVSGTSSVGGLVGSMNGSNNDNATITNSYATGNVRGSSNVGGLIGYKYYGTVTDSYATGDIPGDKDGGLTNSQSGGFVGTFCLGIITESYATGDVYGDSDLGGFGGQSHNCGGTISNSYSMGDVYPSVSGTGGAFIRYIYLGTVTKSYATGSVDGQTNAGFIYYDHTCSSCTNNFWDTEVSGQSTGGIFSGGRATGKTTAQMKDQATYTSWDFSTIWNIDVSVNSGYPYLRWQPVDTTAPTVSTLAPADNETNFSPISNFLMIFNESVNVGTGSITIKKTSDDSTIETIDVSGGLVTGTGTNTISIDPSTNLSDLTEYYILVDATAFDDTAGNSFAGITSSTAWSFTTGDINAPILSSITATPTATGTTIAWTTNEVSSSSVSYGPTVSYGTTTAEADTSPRVTSHSVSITDLACGTEYNYIVISKDAANYTSSDTNHTFTTSSCPDVSTTRRYGSSSSLRVQNLISMGKNEEAKKVIQEFPSSAPNNLNHITIEPVRIVENIKIEEVRKNNEPSVKSTVFSKTLKNGMIDPEVKSLQEFLNIDPATGKFGEITYNAVINFQIKNKLIPDGIVGPLTREVLNN